MIVIIKGKNNKQLIIKAVSMLSLVAMFYLYYQHMSEKFQMLNQELVSKKTYTKPNKKQDTSRKFEQIIYKEAVKVVDLIGQEHVQSIKVVKNRLLLVCDFDSDIEPLLVRYGVKALVKNTSTNIKIALDLRTIVENNYES